MIDREPNLRRIGLVLALGTVAIAIFVTQWPFEYRLTSYAVKLRWTRIDWRWFAHDGAGNIRFDRDFALNLLMLVPLGVGFALWRRAASMRVTLEALAIGTLTSATVELAQLVTRYRYTSFQDLWRNALGCMVGAMLTGWLVRWARSRADRDRPDSSPSSRDRARP
ncbi:hypothetical protein BH11MYX3_BH11MYX3_17070 [soil metagenome]